MKLDKIEKIIIAVLAVIVINAIGMNYYEHQKFIHNRTMPIYLNNTKEKELPKNIRELSKKYQTYTELYKSDKPVLVYSYVTYNSS